jgi:homoserine O-acetyltransferase
MNEAFRLFSYQHAFTLESGRGLPGFHLAYTVHGKLNAAKDNVVWVFHALTANSDPAEWWHGLVGEGKVFDPHQYCIVCVNMPGSCYGSIGPLDTNTETGQPFYHHFPAFTTRDMIRSYQKLQEHLGIKSIAVGLGGSMGGQQLLEWAIEDPELFRHILPIATNAYHSPWGIAFNATQRQCIEGDPTWKSASPGAGMEGMKTARAIALLSYRNYLTYDALQKGYHIESNGAQLDKKVFKAETYQQYQGEKLARRFNAFSYYFLSRSMDMHDVGRGRLSVEAALGSIKARTLVIGISTDLLFPVKEQEFLAKAIPNAKLAVIDSLFGHDGFLLEFAQIEKLVRSFMQTSFSQATEKEVYNH